MLHDIAKVVYKGQKSMQVSRKTQFSMLHDNAKVVYKGQKSMLFKEMVSVTHTQQGVAGESTVEPKANVLALLLRIGGTPGSMYIASNMSTLLHDPDDTFNMDTAVVNLPQAVVDKW